MGGAIIPQGGHPHAKAQAWSHKIQCGIVGSFIMNPKPWCGKGLNSIHPITLAMPNHHSTYGQFMHKS